MLKDNVLILGGMPSAPCSPTPVLHNCKVWTMIILNIIIIILIIIVIIIIILYILIILIMMAGEAMQRACGQSMATRCAGGNEENTTGGEKNPLKMSQKYHQKTPHRR